MAALLFMITRYDAHAQSFAFNRLTTTVTPRSITLEELGDPIELRITTTNTSTALHEDVRFNYTFKSSEIEIVSGCSEELIGTLNQGESISSDCVIRVNPDIPEYLGEVTLSIGTFSKVDSSSRASTTIINITLPRTEANAISSNVTGCFDKESYIKYTKTYTNLGDTTPIESGPISLRYLINRYTIPLAGIILGIYLTPKNRFKKKSNKLRLIPSILLILSALILLVYRINADKCDLFPNLEYCRSKAREFAVEESEFKELLRGEGGMQVEQEILENGNILLKDGFGRWRIEYPPYFTNQFFPETKSVVIAGPSANANPDSGLLTVEARINVFEKQSFAGYDSFRTYVRKTLAKPGVTLLSEDNTTFNIYDAEVIDLRDSTFSNSDITADGKIYFFATTRSFVIFSLYTNNNCREVFADDIGEIINSFLLTDEGVNNEI